MMLLVMVVVQAGQDLVMPLIVTGAPMSISSITTATWWPTTDFLTGMKQEHLVATGYCLQIDILHCQVKKYRLIFTSSVVHEITQSSEDKLWFF